MLQNLHVPWLIFGNDTGVQDPLDHVHKSGLDWLLLFHDQGYVFLFVGSFRQHCDYNLEELECFLFAIMLRYFKQFDIFCYDSLSKPRLEILFYFPHQKLEIVKFLHPHARGLVDFSKAEAKAFSCFQHACENNTVRQIFYIEYLFFLSKEVFWEANHGLEVLRICHCFNDSLGITLDFNYKIYSRCQK